MGRRGGYDGGYGSGGYGRGRRGGGGGIFSSTIYIGLTLVLFWGIFTYGPPMWKEYQQTGSVTIPFINYKVDLRDPHGEGMTLPNLPNTPNMPDINVGSGSNNGNSSAGPQGKAALSVLNSLPVKGKAAKTGYSRDQFGSAWTDKAGDVLYANNGCDTRNDILRRDLTNIKLDKDGCTVLSGVLNDPYIGKTINFERGPKSAAVQIDHIVALGNAWVTGAQQLSHRKRVELANDPLNLVAADGPANGQKSDRDASAWLPANKSARCSYVSAQVNVKKRYSLWVTPAEKSAMTTVLSQC